MRGSPAGLFTLTLGRPAHVQTDVGWARFAVTPNRMDGIIVQRY